MPEILPADLGSNAKLIEVLKSEKDEETSIVIKLTINELIKKLNISSSNRNPIFDVMFAYQPWIYLIFISGIAMRLWAEEFKTRTI